MRLCLSVAAVVHIQQLFAMPVCGVVCLSLVIGTGSAHRRHVCNARELAVRPFERPVIPGLTLSDSMRGPSQEVHAMEVPIAGLEASLVARVAAVRIDGRWVGVCQG